MGFQLFVHSVRLVFNNLGAALRVSLVLYVIYAAVQLWYTRTMFAHVVEMEMGHFPPGSYWVSVLAFLIVAIVTMTWIAIAWHRFVLLGELQGGWLPGWPGGKIGGYVWRSILLVLILVAIILPLSIAVGLLAAGIGPFAMFVTFPVIVGIMVVVMYRLVAILPAYALGKPITISEAWNATRGQTGAILGMVILVIIASIVITLPSLLNPDPFSVITQIYSTVVGWFGMMIGVSIITTIYGVYVENRPLD